MNADPVHEECCGCPVCEPRGLRAIEATFQPWHSDPKEIARLLRWLELIGEQPVDLPLFIENAESYQSQYDELRMWAP